VGLRASGLACQSQAKPSGTLPKRFTPTFQDITYQIANLGYFETAGDVGNRRQLAGRVRPCLRNDDLIRIGIDDKIRVVRHQDDLTLGFRSTEERDQLIVDGLRVQVLFWLINDQRTIIRFIESKIEQ